MITTVRFEPRIPLSSTLTIEGKGVGRAGDSSR